MADNQNNNKKIGNQLAIGTGLGIAVGVLIGMIMNNLPIGIGIGVAMGVAFGSRNLNKLSKNNQEDEVNK